MAPIFIIEHREPQLWPWCLIEYKSISTIVGKKNVWFTNIQKKDVKKLKQYGKVYTHSIRALPLDFSNAFVLDPRASKVLRPYEAQQCKYLILGGILGDEKLNGRTEKELSQFLTTTPKRNIGKKQFSTDNAVYVAHQICKGKTLSQQKFQDTLEISFTPVESVILPYRYPLVNNKPRISSELVRYLKEKESF